MKIYKTRAELVELPDSPLKSIIMEDLEEYLGDGEYFDVDNVACVVIENGDEIFGEILSLGDFGGFPTEEFLPNWELSNENDCWFSLVYLLGDSGEGLNLYIPIEFLPRFISIHGEIE